MAKKKGAKINVDAVGDEPERIVEEAAASEQQSSLNPASKSPKLSPYLSYPITFNVGANNVKYYVPKQFLRATKWSDASPEVPINLSDVNADAGHTLAHFLYTGTYQTLPIVENDSKHNSRTRFERALSTYVMATKNDLPVLTQLAVREAETLGRGMHLTEILEASKKSFTQLGTDAWFHDLLRGFLQRAFEEDHAMLATDAFLISVGKTMSKFIMKIVLALFNDKLEHELEQNAKAREKLAELENNVGSFRVAEKDHCAFDFPSPAQRDQWDHDAILVDHDSGHTTSISNNPLETTDMIEPDTQVELASCRLNPAPPGTQSQPIITGLAIDSDVPEPVPEPQPGPIPEARFGTDISDPFVGMTNSQRKNALDEWRILAAMNTLRLQTAEDKGVEAKGLVAIPETDLYAGKSAVTKEKLERRATREAKKRISAEASEPGKEQACSPIPNSLQHPPSTEPEPELAPQEPQLEPVADPVLELAPEPDVEPRPRTLATLAVVVEEASDPWENWSKELTKKQKIVAKREAQREEEFERIRALRSTMVEASSRATELDQVLQALEEPQKIDRFAGLSKSQRKKLEKKIKDEAKAKDEELARKTEEEVAAAVTATTLAADAGPDDPTPATDVWGAVPSILTKKETKIQRRKRKEAAAMEALEVKAAAKEKSESRNSVKLLPPSPSHTMKDEIGDMHDKSPPHLPQEQSIKPHVADEGEQLHTSAASEDICPHRADHFGGDGWKACEQCRGKMLNAFMNLAQTLNSDQLGELFARA